ncbi:MAG: reverse transcriptase domain-containing protein, partial [Gemmatimonadota bacterium]|nr:reverse transcriptase domain-containing protein [Gemmatimonadota bacterium]
MGVFRTSGLDDQWMGVEWNDLDDDQQKGAVDRGMEDYDEFESWNSKDTRTRAQVDGQVLSGRWVKKAKWRLNEAGTEWLLGGRARWTPRGFEEKGVSAGDAESPTAALSSHYVVEALGRALGFVDSRCDISSAFFQSRKFEDGEKEIWLDLPPEFQPRGEATPKHERLCRRLLREVPGTKQAPRRWQERLAEVLVVGGWEELSMEKCMWVKRVNGKLAGMLTTHVDDMRARASQAVTEELKILLEGTLKVGEFRMGEVESEFVGLQWKEVPEVEAVYRGQQVLSERTPAGMLISQQAYTEQKLREVELPRERWKQ